MLAQTACQKADILKSGEEINAFQTIFNWIQTAKRQRASPFSAAAPLCRTPLSTLSRTAPSHYFVYSPGTPEFCYLFPHSWHSLLKTAKEKEPNGNPAPLVPLGPRGRQEQPCWSSSGMNRPCLQPEDPAPTPARTSRGQLLSETSILRPGHKSSSGPRPLSPGQLRSEAAIPILRNRGSSGSRPPSPVPLTRAAPVPGRQPRSPSPGQLRSEAPVPGAPPVPGRHP